MAEMTNEPSLDEMKQERRAVLEKLLKLSQFCRIKVQQKENTQRGDPQIKMLRSGVPEDLLAALDRRSEARRAPVAKAQNGHCGSCGIRLPGAEWKDLVARNDLTVCQYCGVILHAQEVD